MIGTKGKLYIYPDRSYVLVLEGDWRWEMVAQLRDELDDFKYAHKGAILVVPEGLEVHLVAE